MSCRKACTYGSHIGTGILADAFADRGTTIVGRVETDGYHFNASRALKDGKWQGLALDLDNQPDLTDLRIEKWVIQLKAAFAKEILKGLSQV